MDFQWLDVCGFYLRNLKLPVRIISTLSQNEQEIFLKNKTAAELPPTAVLFLFVSPKLTLLFMTS